MFSEAGSKTGQTKKTFTGSSNASVCRRAILKRSASSRLDMYGSKPSEADNLKEKVERFLLTSEIKPYFSTETA